MNRMSNPIATSTQHSESSGAHVFKFRTLATSPTGDSVITTSRQTFADPSASLSASSVVVADDHYDIAISDDEECGVDNNDDDDDRTDSASDSPSASLAAMQLTTPKRSSAEISEGRNKRASAAAAAAENSAENIPSTTPTPTPTTTTTTAATTVASAPLTLMQTPSPSSRLDPLKGVAAVNRRLDKKEQRSLKRKRKAPLIPDNDEAENTSGGKRSSPPSNGAEIADNSSFNDFLHSTLTTDQMSSLTEETMRSEQAQQLIPPGATRRQILNDYAAAEAEEALLRDEHGDALCLGQIA